MWGGVVALLGWIITARYFGWDDHGDRIAQFLGHGCLFLVWLLVWILIIRWNHPAT
jgi:hypothetical protein